MENTFDLSQIPDIGYDNFADYIEGKHGKEERQKLDKYLGSKSRITIFKYKDRVVSAYSAYAIPNTQE